MNRNQHQEPAIITGVFTGISPSIAEDLMQRGCLVCGAVRRCPNADGLVTRCVNAK